MLTGKKKFSIGDQVVERGERKTVQLSVAKLYDFTDIHIPIEVIRGKEAGPKLFLCGAIHGDEINGTEIIRSVLSKKILSQLHGTLIAVPVVNIFGFYNKTRYLPDRRDLNRSFPGNKEGSFASRVAYVFTREIVRKCTHGIDFHTGAIHRANLPQIRVNIDNPELLKMAKSFGAPVILNSELRDGSLRAITQKSTGPSVLLFEGGEALRFDSDVIKSGVSGCLSVMRSIGMLPPLPAAKKVSKRSYIARSSQWIRASTGGTLRLKKKLGDHVNKNECVAVIMDLLGKTKIEVMSDEEGVVVGISRLPLVNRGDAILHVASFRYPNRVSKRIMDLDWDL